MIKYDYYYWLIGFVVDDNYHGKYYTQLLQTLYNTEFTWDSVAMDANRAADGIDLRVRFADRNEIRLGEHLEPLDGPCSVLEMMVALAIRCEETIMGDSEYGDRTGDWFWNMVSSLGLYQQDDGNFNPVIVEDILRKFLARKYRRDGKGGLFYVKECRIDMRDTDIWYQMMRYLNTL